MSGANKLLSLLASHNKNVQEWLGLASVTWQPYLEVVLCCRPLAAFQPNGRMPKVGELAVLVS